MPNANQQPMTKEKLISRVKACTIKIGVAKRLHDEATVQILRERRALAMRKLAERHNVWTLVNPEGHTEFVDQPEWEQRMTAWARRNGLIPPAVVRLSERALLDPPPPPPASDQSA